MSGLGSRLSRRWLRHRLRRTDGLVGTAGPGTSDAGDAGSTGGWALDPSGEWCLRWLSLMALPVLYNCAVLLCRACFPEVQAQHERLWRGLDALSDVLYAADIGVRLHTAFLEEGLPVRDGARTRRRYLRSGCFLLDAAALAPLDLLLGAPGSPTLRANRCLRAPRLLEAFSRWETRSGSPGAVRLARLALGAAAAVHGYGCLYFALSARLGPGSDAWVCPDASRPGFARPLRQYLHSVHFATLVLAAVGDVPEPRREEEFLFVTAGFLSAVLGFAAITGGVASVLADLDAADAAFHPDPAPALRYLRAQGVAGRLRQRVARWHRHLRAQRKPPAEQEVLRRLPRGLRDEVAADVHLPALRLVGLFQGWEPGVLRRLVLRLRPQVFGPGEFVCRRGDVGREMYFIRDGRLAVVAEDGVTRLAMLGPGLYFGEISLIDIKGNKSGNRRMADIVSIGYSDLFCLAKEDLAEVLAEFPSARATMEAKGRQILLAMGQLDVGAEAAAAEAEQRVRAMEVALEGLQTRAARLLAQLEAGALKLELRVQRLEGRIRRQWPDGQRGPAGGTGPTGGTGPRGAGGPSGVQVLTGVQGLTSGKGPTRVQGPREVQGPSGAQDFTGARGPTRGTGPIKAQGPPRSQGPSGGTGPRGAEGPIKGQDLTGVQGPTRGTGSTRAQGPIRVQGPARVQGPNGAQGPTRGIGPGWVLGPTKVQGPSTEQGAPRSRGSPGVQNLPGVQGPSRGTGSTGAQGPSRVQGPPEFQGPPGAQGPSGVWGPPRSQSAGGVRGAAGTGVGTRTGVGTGTGVGMGPRC